MRIPTTILHSGGDEQLMIGILNRMRLFAPPRVVTGAEAVLRAILEIALKPRVELRQLAKEALSKSLDPDPLLAFSRVCRADLDQCVAPWREATNSIRSSLCATMLISGIARFGIEGSSADGRPPFECIALLLQGGGALVPIRPESTRLLPRRFCIPTGWREIPIGAINSALIAGNAPEARVTKLRAFWRK